MVLKLKEGYRTWLVIHHDFPRTERFGLGARIEGVFLDLLELSSSSVYMPIEPKIVTLGKSIARLDTLRFLLQLAWENKLIATAKYSALTERLEESGRMMGGWRKGLIQKLPSQNDGRKTASFGTTTR